jgi:biopolymer transport protein ExbB
MLWLTDSIEAIRDFMELGGPVLRWIAFTIFVMWALIIERLVYFRKPMKPGSRERSANHGMRIRSARG